MGRSRLTSRGLLLGAGFVLLALSVEFALAAHPNDEHFRPSRHQGKIGPQVAGAASPGSPDVTVAVIDTGGNANHRDLAGLVVEGWNLWTNSADTSPGCGPARPSRASARPSGTQWAARRRLGGRVVDPARCGLAHRLAERRPCSRRGPMGAGRAAKAANVSTSVRHWDVLRDAVRYAWSCGGGPGRGQRVPVHRPRAAGSGRPLPGRLRRGSQAGVALALAGWRRLPWLAQADICRAQEAENVPLRALLRWRRVDAGSATSSLSLDLAGLIRGGTTNGIRRLVPRARRSGSAAWWWPSGKLARPGPGLPSGRLVPVGG